MIIVALFGAGRIGRIHAKNAAARSDLKLKYIVDPNREASGPLARLTGAMAVDSDAALGDASISGVIIASVTNAHLDQALQAAAAGKARSVGSLSLRVSRVPIVAASALVTPWIKRCTQNPGPNTGRSAGI